ncbi:MAG: VacJ family lipoprotein [Desulfobacterales bacterium]|jgi:phospholipid-binding lipoprotein MlaA
MIRFGSFSPRLLTAVLLCLVLSIGRPALAAETDAQQPAGAEAQRPAAPGAPAPDKEDAFFDDLYQEAEIGAVQVYDPIEPVNRVFFEFNDRFYFWVVKPVATGYRFVIPTEIRTCIKNFFFNLLAPIRIANCLLQGKGYRAGNELLRLTINTTAGLGGLADVADRYPELKSTDEDLGQTMAVWGMGNGFYLVIPFLGPSSLRDGVGWVGDRYLSPVTWTVSSFGDGVAIYAGRSLNDVSFRIGDYETLKAASLDPYAAFRDGYIQYRNSKIQE